jgi:hypothetical protein
MPFYNILVKKEEDGEEPKVLISKASFQSIA